MSRGKGQFAAVISTPLSWRHGLLFKLAGVVGVVLVLGVFSVFFFTVSFIGRTLETNLRDEAILTAEALDAGFESRGSLLSADRIKQEVDELVGATENLDLIAVYRDRGGLMQPFVTTEDSTYIPPPTALEQRDLRLGNRIVKKVSNSEAGPFWRILVPMHLEKRVRGAIEVRMSLQIATESVAELRSRARLVGAFSVFGSVILLAFFLHRLVERPVQRLLGTMAQVQDGDLGATAPGGGGAEFNRLSSGFNAMLTRIREGSEENERLVREVQQFNQQLERRVAEKTAELETRNAQLQDANRAMLDLELRLARLSRLAAVGQFAAKLAHEIGTPLHSISGHLELLKEKNAVLPGHEHRIQVIQSQLDRVAGIVRDLLGSTRAPGVPQVAVKLTAVLEELRTLLQPGLEPRKIKMEFDVPPALPSVAADPNQLQQVFLNLFTNAVDAMPGGGTISVHARLMPGSPARVRCVVADTGTGIELALLPHVFEPFVTSKPAGEGSGLGLAVAHDIVARMGGTVEAASESGRGSRFTLDLPVFEEAFRG